MADLTQILQGVASGLLTGGASAGTTFLTVFKNIKGRIAELEAKVGAPDTDPKTGIFLTLDNLTRAVRNVKSEIESWRDDPPDWLVRIIQQKASRGTMSNEVWREFEERMEQRMRGFKDSLKRLEDDLDQREEKLHDEIEKSSPEFNGLFIMREEYEADSQKRAEETRKIQQNLASANSFLRGVMAALGYVDPAPPSPTPPPPRPALPPRPIPKKK